MLSDLKYCPPLLPPSAYLWKARLVTNLGCYCEGCCCEAVDILEGLLVAESVPLKEILEPAHSLLLGCPGVISSSIYHMLLPQDALPQAQNTGARQSRTQISEIRSPHQPLLRQLTYWGGGGAYIPTRTSRWLTVPIIIFANNSDSAASLHYRPGVSYIPFTNTFPQFPTQAGMIPKSLI